LFRQSFFRKHAPSEKGPYGISPEVMDTYVKSCGESDLNGAMFDPLPAEDGLTPSLAAPFQLVTVS